MTDNLKHTIDSNCSDNRNSRVRSLILNHIKNKYPSVVDVHVFSNPFKKPNIEFDILIDIDMRGYEQLEYKSMFNREIRKDVYNLTKYILGEKERVNNISAIIVNQEE